MVGLDQPWERLSLVWLDLRGRVKFDLTICHIISDLALGGLMMLCHIIKVCHLMGVINLFSLMATFNENRGYLFGFEWEWIFHSLTFTSSSSSSSLFAPSLLLVVGFKQGRRKESESNPRRKVSESHIEIFRGVCSLLFFSFLLLPIPSESIKKC